MTSVMKPIFNIQYLNVRKLDISLECLTEKLNWIIVSGMSDLNQDVFQSSNIIVIITKFYFGSVLW